MTADAARKPCQGCGTPGSPGMPQTIHCGHCPPWTCNHCGRIASLASPCGCWVTFDGLPLADIKGHLAVAGLSVETEGER